MWCRKLRFLGEPEEGIKMTWEEAYSNADDILKSNSLDNVVKINRLTREEYGDKKRVHIERFPVKGNLDLIKKLRSIDAFYGFKSLGYDNKFMFWGWFEIN